MFQQHLHLTTTTFNKDGGKTSESVSCVSINRCDSYPVKFNKCKSILFHQRMDYQSLIQYQHQHRHLGIELQQLRYLRLLQMIQQQLPSDYTSKCSITLNSTNTRCSKSLHYHKIIQQGYRELI